MARRGKKQKYVLITEVLQNGYPVANFSCPMGKNKNISLGRRPRNTLEIPFYEFARRNYKLVRLRGSKAKLYCPPGWHGFVSSNGKKFDLSKPSRKTLSFKLVANDYAAFYFQDLSFLVRIAPEKTEPKKIKISGSVRPTITSLIFHSKTERRAAMIGFAMALVLASPILFWLNETELARPKGFNDLSARWILPYIYPKHLENIPEALQDKLDRKDYIQATLDFVEANTSQLMGAPIKNTKLLFPSSMNLNTKAHTKQRQKLEKLFDEQTKAEKELLAKSHRAVVALFSVSGESVHGLTARFFDKFDLMHLAFEQNLANRRKLSTEFAEDVDYNFEDYHKPAFRQSKEAQEALGKISPFSLLNNEETMYQTALNLGKHALAATKKRNDASTPKDPLFDSDRMPIGINPDFPGLSFLDRSEFRSDDTKINGIMASEFAFKGQRKIKEPLIGEIDSKIIERTIIKKSYELQLCYELALRKDQMAHGKMEWSWRIDSFGSTSDLALLSTTIRDKSMEACIKKKIASWTFPRPVRGSVEVQYPFVFRKDNG